MFELPPFLKVAREAKPDLSIVDDSEISSIQPVQVNKTNGFTVQGNSTVQVNIFIYFPDKKVMLHSMIISDL